MMNLRERERGEIERNTFVVLVKDHFIDAVLEFKKVLHILPTVFETVSTDIFVWNCF
jgi:hypothetical protein